jgi:hypothetical protein
MMPKTIGELAFKGTTTVEAHQKGYHELDTYEKRQILTRF